MAGKHPGFKSVQNSIAQKEGISGKRAGAILAASSRNASPAAKKKNPRLRKVKGEPDADDKGKKKMPAKFMNALHGGY